MTPAILTRAQWGGGVPASLPNVPLPARQVFIHHSVTGGDEVTQCRQVQAAHRSRGYADIGYNAMVGQSGRLYEGRDPVLAPEDVGGHTLGWNAKSFAICCLGNFEHEPPTPAMIDSIRWLIAVWRFTGKLTGDSAIRPHRDVYATQCPGKHMPMEAIRVPWDGGQTPEPPRAPLPAPVTLAEYPEEQVKTQLVIVRCDAHGNGWSDAGPGAPVAVSLQGPYPPKDGYWYHLRYRPTPSLQEHGGKLVVTVTDGPANADIGVLVASA